MFTSKIFNHVFSLVFFSIISVALVNCGGSGGGGNTTAPPNSSKSIAAFSLNGVAGTIDEANKTIVVVMPSGTDLSALIATFDTTGSRVKVGNTAQVSGTTPNNFTNAVIYTVTAVDKSTVDYTVSVLFQRLVINEIFGGGSSLNSAFDHDFVELRNTSSLVIDLTGWSLQYASAIGNTWRSVNLTGSVGANSYYLIQLSASSTGGAVLPTPNVSDTVSVSNTAAKIALVNSATVLSGGCPTDTAIVDFVGYGAAASCFWGVAAAPNLTSSVHSLMRTVSGAQSKNNAVDFVNVTPPTPGS